MVEWIFGILSFCIVATILCKVFEHYNKEYALYISIAVVAVISVFAFVCLSPVTDIVRGLFIRSGLSEDYAVILFKCIGICYITQLACDICRDNGESAISTIAELSGKTALIIISLPLIQTVIEIITELSAG